MTLKVFAFIWCLGALAPAVAQDHRPDVTPETLAQDHLAHSARTLSLQATSDPTGEQCRRVDNSDPAGRVPVVLHRTFNDDFDEHPLAHGRWAPHYAGGAAWPEARYWGGDGSQLKRQTKYNGEQQIYVDPLYAGRGDKPLGLDPFKVRDGVLSIVARRTPAELGATLFANPYMSGILTTQGWFSQKYGYFEIRAKIPVGTGVWPAFWMLADNGGWPPEIDIMEGRGQQPGDLVMTTHWRIPSTQKIISCGFDFQLADASQAFHDYGILWLQDRLIYLIDRKPVSDVKVPVGFDDPMYMIINLAMGSKWFGGVGVVDGESPDNVEFQIDRVSAYQIDPFQPYNPSQRALPTEAIRAGSKDGQ